MCDGRSLATDRQRVGRENLGEGLQVQGTAMTSGLLDHAAVEQDVEPLCWVGGRQAGAGRVGPSLRLPYCRASCLLSLSCS